MQTQTKKLDLVGQVCPWPVIFTVKELKKLENIRGITGPILILVKISKSKKTSKRVNIEPTKIKTRFMESLHN